MTTLEKKNKRKGIIGTIFFHTVLLVAFLFMGLTYQDPPPPEEGISINFGFNDQGLGEINPEDIDNYHLYLLQGADKHLYNFQGVLIR